MENILTIANHVSSLDRMNIFGTFSIERIQWLAKVSTPFELFDLLSHFRLQTLTSHVPSFRGFFCVCVKKKKVKIYEAQRWQKVKKFKGRGHLFRKPPYVQSF